MQYSVRTMDETASGKKIMLQYDTQTNLYVLKFAPGGALPKEFEGSFTSASAAEKVVRGYLARKSPKRAKKTEVLNG